MGQVGGGIFGELNTISSLISTVYGLGTFVMFAAWWVFQGFTWLYIGRKAGLDKDWMPFVPFAKTIYRLKIVNEEWWKMFLFEGYVIYGFLLFIIIQAISGFQWLTFGVILVLIYSLACIAYNMYWRYKFYLAFDIRPHMALTILVPFVAVYRWTLDCLVAFTSNYVFGGPSKLQPVSVEAGNAANVPQSPGVQPGTMTGLSGMYAGQQIPLAINEELLIGRDGTCNLIIDKQAEKLSRKHCSILYDRARNVYMVTDFSSNGTYIDGGNRLVANMATQLQRGTVIALGNRENRFRLN